MSKEQKKHPVLKAAAITTAAGVSAYAGYAYYLFRQAFDLDRSRFTLDHYYLYSCKERQEGLSWFTNTEHEEATITAFDGLKLHGIVVNPHKESHNWIIFQHGYHACCKDMIPYMIEAEKRGFNVLSTDARGSGLSEGRFTSLGWLEHYDLISWVGYITSIDKDAKIVLYGVSMGAVSVMNACGDYLPANVKCGIEESGYIDMFREIEYLAEQRKSIKMPIKCFKKGVEVYVRQCLHFSLDDANTRRQLENARIPMMFIHAEEDETVPKINVFESFNACASEKELYVLKGLRHLESRRDEQYFEKVFTFIEKYLNA